MLTDARLRFTLRMTELDLTTAAPSRRRFPFAAMIVPALILALLSSARAENVRLKVLEVKGEFVKLEPQAGVALGASGKLYRLSAGVSPQGEIKVTSVQAAYVVGKISNGTPQVGDFVLLPSSASAADATTTSGGAKADAAAAANDGFDKLIGQEIHLLLKSEELLDGAKLLRIARDSKSGKLKALRVEFKGEEKTVLLTDLKTASHAGSDLELPSADDGDEKPGRTKTRNQLLAEQRAEREAKERAAWLERLKERGVQPWPELTAEEHQAAVEEYKQKVVEIQKVYQNMQLHETAQFLVCTNIPPQQVGPYIISLDKMYDMMCVMYNIKQGTPVWKGKALVVAFLTQAEFLDFERRFMQTTLSGSVYGVCHQNAQGDVLMACYRGDQTAEFGQMLVHETSHGFIHRYKTPLRFPSWVNEGMADYIGCKLVPASRAVPGRERQAVLQMRQTRSMGGDFFTGQGLAPWQYGVASSLADFMIRSNPKAYVHFIEGMKEGLSWEESLKESYKATPEELVMSYGRAIGVPDLRP